MTQLLRRPTALGSLSAHHPTRDDLPTQCDRDRPSGPFAFADIRLVVRTAVGALEGRRQARADYRALERSLATYSTRAEVDDVLATIQGQDDAEAQLIRRILTTNLRQRNHQLASFRPHASGAQ
jgi:hypothetical protein